MYFLNKWILSYKNILEYFHKLFLIANLNKPYEERSNTSVIYVWLDTKTGFNDNFTKPKLDLHIQVTDTCHKIREVCACSYIFDKLGFLCLFFLST